MRALDDTVRFLQPACKIRVAGKTATIVVGEFQSNVGKFEHGLPVAQGLCARGADEGPIAA